MVMSKLFVFLVLLEGLYEVDVVSFLVVDDFCSYDDVVFLLEIYKEFDLVLV